MIQHSDANPDAWLMLRFTKVFTDFRSSVGHLIY